MTIKPDIARGNDHLEREVSWIQLLLYKVSFLKAMCCFKAMCERKFTKAQCKPMEKHTCVYSLYSEDG